MNSTDRTGRMDMNRLDLTTIVETLLQLQANELETASIHSLLKSLPDRLSALSARLEEFKTRITESESRMSELKKTYRRQESEAQTIQAKIDKSNQKLKTVKTNKEYQAGLQEIEELSQMQSGVEDSMLECLEAIDEAEAAVASERERFADLSRQVSEEKAQLENESAQMQQKLQQLLRRNEQILAAVEPQMLKKYKQVKEYTGATAVAAVKASICQGCNMNIPPQMYNELQRFDRMLFCPHCERIIYPHGRLDGDSVD